MEIKMKPGYWPDLPKMLRTVQDAGYTPIAGGVELVVSGRVARQDGCLVLDLDGMKSPTRLLIVPAKEAPETAPHLERHVGERVRVEGAWLPAPAGQPGPGSLAVTRIEETE